MINVGEKSRTGNNREREYFENNGENRQGKKKKIRY